MATFFPEDKEMIKKGWECHPSPASRLGQQPVRRRFSKSLADYEARASELRLAWPAISGRLSQAEMFQHEFISIVQNLRVE